MFSYGSPLATQLGCGFLTQLANGVDAYLDGKSEAIAHLKNAHGFTMLILLSTMVLEKNFLILFYLYMCIYFINNMTSFNYRDCLKKITRSQQI